MTKLLIWHSDEGPKYFDVSTPELEKGAYQFLLDTMGADGYYDASSPEDEELTLFDMAVGGDAVAVKEFLWMRSSRDNEYEKLEVVEPKVIMPM